MRHTVITAIIITVMGLVGCAASPDLANNEGVEAFNRGDFNKAKASFEKSVAAGNMSAYNNLGVLHAKRGDRANAIAYYNLAARWGVTEARHNLLQLGQPVPAADLLIASQQRAAQQKARDTGDLQRALDAQAALQEAANHRQATQEPWISTRPTTVQCSTTAMNPGVIGQIGQGAPSYTTNCQAR